jgi:hypothetical protein
MGAIISILSDIWGYSLEIDHSLIQQEVNLYLGLYI